MHDDRLRTSLGHAVVRLFRLVNRATNRALKDREVSAEQAHVLLALWIEGAMPMGALQKLLSLSSATLTGAIDRMESQGLVRRVPSPDDRRVSLLEPRMPARKRAEIEALLVEADRRSFAVLTAAERKELLRLLDKCIAGLDAE